MQHKKTAGLLALLLAAPLTAQAGSANVSFNSPGRSTPLAVISQPVVEVPLVFTTIQTKTEHPITTSVDEAATVPALQGAGVGMDTYFSKDLKIYNIPLSYSFTPNFQVKLDIPIVTARNFNYNTSRTNTETGVGDISLSAKYRIGNENRLESQTFVTTKFASGDHEKGLGTGSYDITVTEKLIKRINNCRLTLMAGVSQALNDPKYYGYKIDYGTSLAYMAAAEHQVWLPELWFGVKASGIHSFSNKINGLSEKDATTTLDITPEVKYYFGKGAAVVLGVIVPAVTDYDRNTVKRDRDVTVNFGLFKSF